MTAIGHLQSVYRKIFFHRPPLVGPGNPRRRPIGKARGPRAPPGGRRASAGLFAWDCSGVEADEIVAISWCASGSVFVLLPLTAPAPAEHPGAALNRH
jgi:hypothetical protein